MTSSNGSGKGARAALLRLLACHISAVKSLRISIALLDKDQTTQKERRLSTVMQQAIQIDAARRDPELLADLGPEGEPATREPFTNAKRHEQRKRTAAFLKQFRHNEPRRPNGNGRPIGTMLNNGYLARKGDGYVRTAKKFVV